DGVLLRTAPEERPGPEAVADPRRAPDRDRHLDRTQVSPPPSTGPSGSIDPHRIRDHHEPGREPRGLTPQLSPNGAAVPCMTPLTRQGSCCSLTFLPTTSRDSSRTASCRSTRSTNRTECIRRGQRGQ